MPSKGQRLSQNEMLILSYWIRLGAPWPKGPEKSLYRQAELEPRTPEIPAVSGGLTNPVDRLVNVYFERNNIKWGTNVNDRLYIRRVYLDLIGLLPPADSVEAFIQNRRPDKREMLVGSLLSRPDDYAQHWLSFGMMPFEMIIPAPDISLTADRILLNGSILPCRLINPTMNL